MTTITRLKQLKDWLQRNQQAERLPRKELVERPTATIKCPDVLCSLFEHSKIDRFATYREKIVPLLRDCGYGYFLACDGKEYIEHQKWCDEYCIDSSLPHCDVWQIDTKYPRAFASKVDAAMFKITFDATKID